MTDQVGREGETEAAAGGEWYRSPLVLLAGLIVFAGVIAAIVVGASSGDTEQDLAASPTSTPHVVTGAAPAPSFGGEGIPEVDDVIITGEALTPFTTTADDASLGATAPTIRATSLANGASIELGPGQARVLGFFAHWCPHCRAELPELTTWLRDTKLPPGTQFVAVSTAVSPDRGNYPPSEWFAVEQWPAPVIVDDDRSTLLSTFGFSGFLRS